VIFDQGGIVFTISNRKQYKLKRANSPELATLFQAVQWHNEFQNFKGSNLGLQLGKLANGQAKQIEAFRKPPMADLFTGELAPEKSGPAWDMFTQLIRAKSQKEVAEFFAAKADELSEKTGRLFQGAVNDTSSTAAKIKQLKERAPMDLRNVAPVANKAAVKDIFRGFGPVTNQMDGRSVVFPAKSAGKIEKHRGFDMKQVVAAFDRLFADSIPMFPEKEIRKKGHKPHNNIAAYHYYVSKFTRPNANGNPTVYYIRFTVQEMKSRKGNGENFVHSAFVSDVSIYDESALSGWGWDSPVIAESGASIDVKLAQWLSSVKSEDAPPDISSGPAVIETLYQPGYHGSPHRFDRFSLDAIGAGEGAQIHGWGLYALRGEGEDRKWHADERYRKRLLMRNDKVTVNGAAYTYNWDDYSYAPIGDGEGGNPGFVREMLGEMRHAGGPENYSAYLVRSMDTQRRTLKKLRDMASSLPADGRYFFGENADGSVKLVESAHGDTITDRIRDVEQGIKDIGNRLEFLKTAKIEMPAGQLFKVDIPDDDVLLDEDLTFEEQPDAVQKGLRELFEDRAFRDIYFFDNDTGKEIYGTIIAALKKEYPDYDSDNEISKMTSKMLNEFGIKGIAYEGETDGSAAVVFDDNAIEVLETYYQGEKDGAEKRDVTTLYQADAEHRQANVIRVMKGGDLSTILHELGHIFFDDMQEFVLSEKAPESVVRDYARLLQALGPLKKPKGVDWNSDEGKQIRANNEQMARWFEEYLREGRAPSMELVKPFGLFSKWITNVYSNIRQYVGREMNRETRGVFDRWLAAEREIAEAEAYYGGLESADFLNLVDDEEKRKKLEEKLARTRQRILNRHAGEMANFLDPVKPDNPSDSPVVETFTNLSPRPPNLIPALRFPRLRESTIILTFKLARLYVDMRGEVGFAVLNIFRPGFWVGPPLPSPFANQVAVSRKRRGHGSGRGRSGTSESQRLQGP
jgi:hypothetical protein